MIGSYCRWSDFFRVGSRYWNFVIIHLFCSRLYRNSGDSMFLDLIMFNLASKEGLYSYALLTILASKVWLLVRLVCGWEIFRSDCWGCIFIAFRRLSTQTLSPIRSLLQLCQLGCLRFSRSLKSSSLWKIKDSHLV